MSAEFVFFAVLIGYSCVVLYGSLRDHDEAYDDEWDKE
jgi:hypothetical protein